ncbi:Facilitated glucose transporter protein [Dirofilaria immitis]
MANDEQKGRIPSSEAAEKERLLKHEEAAKALGKPIYDDMKGGWTQPLLMAVASAAVGGSFQFGYHIGCVNVPAKVIKLWMIESHKELFGETLTLDEIGRVQ